MHPLRSTLVSVVLPLKIPSSVTPLRFESERSISLSDLAPESMLSTEEQPDKLRPLISSFSRFFKPSILFPVVKKSIVSTFGQFQLLKFSSLRLTHSPKIYSIVL